MAGHSKWANIRFRKGLQDSRRGKIFTKLIREITLAARMGGADELVNSRLRDVISKALKANMKRDTIDNAIKRGVGGPECEHMQEMRYEGYASGGVAILVDCLSDNKNRTVSEVRHAFAKRGGNLVAVGSVAYLFENKGEISLEQNHAEEAIVEIAIDAGAEDILTNDDQIDIITSVADYHRVLTILQDKELHIEHSDLVMRAQVLVPLDKLAADNLMLLIDALEDLDDVQKVYTNAKFPDDYFRD